MHFVPYNSRVDIIFVNTYKRHELTLNCYINKPKNQTAVNFIKLSPTITVCLVAKFNPTITFFLIPYIKEGYDRVRFCNWISLLAKVEHISYIGMHLCFS